MDTPLWSLTPGALTVSVVGVVGEMFMVSSS
jgi:hypothetical protein